MKLTSCIYFLALLGLVRPGLITLSPKPAATTALPPFPFPIGGDNAAINSSSLLEQKKNITTENSQQVLYRLFHIDQVTANQEQKNMISRILNVNSPCQDIKMLCEIDSLLRNVTQDLIVDGVTDISQQVNGEKFDSLLSRLLSTMNQNVLRTYFPGSNLNEDELYFWKDQGPEFQAFMKLTLELESLIKNHDEFTPSSIVSPFIISDLNLKEAAIQKLLESPSFQLKPLSKQGKFYEFQKRINSQIHVSTDMNGPHIPEQVITIPIDKVLGYNFASSGATPELDSTDIVNSTIAIDEGNSKLLELVEAEEIIMMNVILRGLIGDLLGIVLDLPGKLLGGDGLTISIGLGGGKKNDGGRSNNNDSDYDDEYEEPKRKPVLTSTKRKAPPVTTTTRRRAPTNK